jgi:hypothetical protein
LPWLVGLQTVYELDARTLDRAAFSVLRLASIDGHPQDPTTAIFLRKE